MNVDGVITSIANQLVEVLKVPAEMAWKYGVEYMRIKGMVTFIPEVAAGITFFVLLLIFYKKMLNKWIPDWIEEDPGDVKTTFGAASVVWGFVAMMSFAFSLVVFHTVNGLMVNVFRMMYPEAMLIYQIVDKVMK